MNNRGEVSQILRTLKRLNFKEAQLGTIFFDAKKTSPYMFFFPHQKNIVPIKSYATQNLRHLSTIKRDFIHLYYVCDNNKVRKKYRRRPILVQAKLTTIFGHDHGEDLQNYCQNFSHLTMAMNKI